MKTTEKRGKQFNILLTDKEAEKLATLCEKTRRKPSELLYILCSETLAQINPDNCGVGVVIEDLR